MRRQASILHLDMDAFFAAVEQRDKPSLRGKPVIVGGVGSRGVVATASYEARGYGVHSAMPITQARRLCPHGAYLVGRFDVYRGVSRQVMNLLRQLSPLVEPVSLDEAYVDLAAGDTKDFSVKALEQLAADLRRSVAEETRISASVGIASNKFLAKIASEMAKPDGHQIVEAGAEAAVVAPMKVRSIPGVGPATAGRLERLGVVTVSQLRQLSEVELIRELGEASGRNLARLAWGKDDRSVAKPGLAKSISVEDTFSEDVVTRDAVLACLQNQSEQVASRVQRAGLFARTITLKIRTSGFETFSRSRTVLSATNDAERIALVCGELLPDLDWGAGIRLVGVGTANFVRSAQEELFSYGPQQSRQPQFLSESVSVADSHYQRRWLPGADVTHDEFGPGWVWGSGKGWVTIRFETEHSGVGSVRSFAVDDPALA